MFCYFWQILKHFCVKKKIATTEFLSYSNNLTEHFYSHDTFYCIQDLERNPDKMKQASQTNAKQEFKENLALYIFVKRMATTRDKMCQT